MLSKIISEVAWATKLGDDSCGGGAICSLRAGRRSLRAPGPISLKDYCIGVPSLGTRSCGVAVGGCMPSFSNTTIVSFE